MTDEANEFGLGEFGGQYSSGLSANFKVLIDDCLRAGGILTTDTKYRQRALTFATYVQMKALKGRHWKFLNAELAFDTDAPYETGTVKLVQNSNEVIEEEIPPAIKEIQWNSTHKGSKFCPTGRDVEYYRILEVPDSKILTLDGDYVGDSTTTPASYKILKDRYVLDVKVDKIGSVMVSGIGEIKPIGLQKFRNMESYNPCLTGFPEYYTVVETEPDSGQITLELYPAPEKKYSVRVEYKQRITTPEDSESCYSAIPPHHMDVLFYGVMAEIYRYQNNTAMAQEMSREYISAWTKFASDQDLVDPLARVQHQRHYFHRYRRNRYRGYFGLDWFGKVED